jgi:hypothetical protein
VLVVVLVVITGAMTGVLLVDVGLWMGDGVVVMIWVTTGTVLTEVIVGVGLGLGVGVGVGVVIVIWLVVLWTEVVLGVGDVVTVTIWVDTGEDDDILVVIIDSVNEMGAAEFDVDVLNNLSVC